MAGVWAQGVCGRGQDQGRGLGFSGKLAGRWVSEHGLGGTLFREFGVWEFPSEEVLNVSSCGSGYLGARHSMGAVYDDGYELPGVARRNKGCDCTRIRIFRF